MGTKSALRHKISEGHHQGEVWKTENGKYRSMSPEGDVKSFDDSEKAKAHAKGKGQSEDHGESEGHKGPSLKEVATKFLDKLKGVPSATKNIIQKSPENVKNFVVNKDHRKTVTDSIVSSMKKGAKGIPKLLKDATKAEVKEIHSGVKAFKKFFKKPPEKLTKHDKKALYAVGSYVAVAAVAGVAGGAALAATGFGKAFAKHIATKAIHKVLDHGLTHFEMGESILHGLHHFVGHTASANRVARRFAGEDVETTDDDLSETLLAYLHEAIRQTLSDGLSDDDMGEILKSLGEGEGSVEVEKESKKTASLRSELIRVAHENPLLRPKILAILT